MSARFNLATQQMKVAISEIGSISGSISTEILEGPAAEAIINIAHSREIELIIMGTCGRD
jgi:nucleotide-binding universal stress UspA family protein